MLQVTANPWTWRSLVLKVFLSGEFMHEGQIAGPASVVAMQSIRACKKLIFEGEIVGVQV